MRGAKGFFEESFIWQERYKKLSCSATIFLQCEKGSSSPEAMDQKRRCSLARCDPTNKNKKGQKYCSHHLRNLHSIDQCIPFGESFTKHKEGDIKNKTLALTAYLFLDISIKAKCM